MLALVVNTPAQYTGAKHVGHITGQHSTAQRTCESITAHSVAHVAELCGPAWLTLPLAHSSLQVLQVSTSAGANC